MDWLQVSGMIKGDIIEFSDYAHLVGGAGNAVDAIRKAKKIYDDAHFVPTVKRAILIGHKKYLPSSNMKDLSSAHDDVKAVYDFLHQKCNFDLADIKQYYDTSEEELKQVFADVREKWAKKLTSGDKMQKGLLFIYYSGHGILGNHVTNIICPDGKTFPLPLVLHCANKNNSLGYGIGIATIPNVMALAFMDCCRVTPKGGNEEEELINGQYYIYYAVQPGVAASTDSTPGAVSAFTKKFLATFNTELEEKGMIQLPEALDEHKYIEKGGSLKVDIAIKPIINQ